MSLSPRLWVALHKRISKAQKVKTGLMGCKSHGLERARWPRAAVLLLFSPFSYSPLFHKHLVAWIKRGKKGQRRGWGRFLCCVMGGKGGRVGKRLLLSHTVLDEAPALGNLGGDLDEDPGWPRDGGGLYTRAHPKAP